MKRYIACLTERVFALHGDPEVPCTIKSFVDASEAIKQALAFVGSYEDEEDTNLSNLIYLLEQPGPIVIRGLPTQQHQRTAHLEKLEIL